jgi:predicted kinase
MLIDNTHVSRESRKLYVGIAKQAGKSIGAIFLDTAVITCLERNRGREDAIPERLISRLAAEKELPEVSEGFKDVLVLDAY